MRTFIKLTGLSVQRLMYYRTSFLLNLITPIIQLAGQYLFWYALYNQQGGLAIGGMKRETMFTYILIAFALNNLLSWSTENTLSREIRNGTVVARCIRPIPFISQAVSEMLGAVVTQGIVNFTVVILSFFCMGDYLKIPGSTAVILFIPCMLLSVLLRILMIDLFSLLCFFCTGYLGITWTRIALFEFFSGALIPVTMFPDWLQAATYITPFPYMLQIPISVLLEQRLPISLPRVFLIQIVWIGIFFVLHNLIYSRVRHNMNIAGG